jgi:PAS domain S-box-containing protein
VQAPGVDILWIAVGGSFVLLTVAMAYILTVSYSHRRIMQTQRAKLEEIKASEEKYKSLYDNSLAGMMRFAVESWTVIDSNAAIREMFGAHDHEELQRCISMLPEFSLDAIRSRLAHDGVIEQYELEASRLDGEQVWLLFSAKMMSNEKGVQAVLINITERKRLESHLLRSQKMEGIALLTGGLAHDLQNVLAPIDLSVHLLRKRMSGKSNRAIIGAISRSARTGLDLVDSILTYGKGVAGERKNIRVSRVIGQVLSSLRRGLATNIRVNQDLKHQKWRMLGDEGQLKQVFRNLCVNARDAMPRGGVLSVEAQDINVNEAHIVGAASPVTGPYVVIRVSDTGDGIAQGDLDRIFEPFFTTKAGSGGTGLGLSVAQGIIKSHKGYLTVSSRKGGGATFCVYLPAYFGKPAGTKP